MLRNARRRLWWLILASLSWSTPAFAQVTINYTFTNGTRADANEVNDNFSRLSAQSLNRTGGTMTGTLTSRAIVPSADATYALGSGAFRFTTGDFSGIVTAGTFAGSGASLTALPAASLTGTIDCARYNALTGDVTSSAGGCVTAIAAGAIVNADVNASAAIAYSKLNLAGSIVNADVGASAAIAYSKLNLSGSILNADVNASAAIAYSKLNLSGSVVNADVSAAAAIAWTKISKTGSSFADFTTRSASDISSGSLDQARLSNVGGTPDATRTCDTPYVAATDLIVVAASTSSGRGTITSESFDASTPTGGIAGAATMFVRKGQTYQVTLNGGSCGVDVVIKVFPIGG